MIKKGTEGGLVRSSVHNHYNLGSSPKYYITTLGRLFPWDGVAVRWFHCARSQLWNVEEFCMNSTTKISFSQWNPNKCLTITLYAAMTVQKPWPRTPSRLKCNKTQAYWYVKCVERVAVPQCNVFTSSCWPGFVCRKWDWAYGRWLEHNFDFQFIVVHLRLLIWSATNILKTLRNILLYCTRSNPKCGGGDFGEVSAPNFVDWRSAMAPPCNVFFPFVFSEVRGFHSKLILCIPPLLSNQEKYYR